MATTNYFDEWQGYLRQHIDNKGKIVRTFEKTELIRAAVKITPAEAQIQNLGFEGGGLNCLVRQYLPTETEAS